METIISMLISTKIVLSTRTHIQHREEVSERNSEIQKYINKLWRSR